MKVITRTRKQVYKRWIAALRSGKYTQGRKQLKVDNSTGMNFCCLGVLCDLAAKDGGVQWNGERYGTDGFFTPDSITDFMVGNQGRFGVLAEMNDSGKSFAQIADYIEKYIMPVECK